MRRAIIESPYRGRWFWQRCINRRYARMCMRDSLMRGEAPYASHLLYTQPGVLKDEVSSERKMGIEAGLAWSEKADVVAVYEDLGLSEGMKLGIAKARSKGIPIHYRTLARV